MGEWVVGWVGGWVGGWVNRLPVENGVGFSRWHVHIPACADTGGYVVYEKDTWGRWVGD